MWEEDGSDLVYGKTYDKRILGILNEQIKTMKHYLETAEIKRNPLMKEEFLIALNRNIFKNRNQESYSSPMEHLSSYLKKKEAN